MKKIGNIRKLITKLTIITIVLFSLFGCANTSSDNTETKAGTVKSSYDLNGYSVATVVGSVQENLAINNYHDSPIIYNTDFSTCIASVAGKKADFTIMPECQFEACKDDYPDLIALYPAIVNTEVYFGFSRNETSKKYLNEINAYIEELDNKSELKSLTKKWSDPDYNETYDFNELTGVNGTLYFATGVWDRPYFFQSGDKYGGVEAEILYGFALKHGYNIDVSILETSAVLAGLTTGRFNLASTLVYTAERAETMDFSIKYAEIDQVVVCHVDLLQDIPMYRDLDELENKKVGVYTGAYEEIITYQVLPNSQYGHYSTFADALLSVSNGKTEATLLPESQLKEALSNYSNIMTQQKPVAYADAYFGMPKTEFGYTLHSQLNEYLINISLSHELDKMWEYWTSVDKNDEYKTFDFKELEATNGTISLVFEPLALPQIHVYKDYYAGYEAEILYNFALEYGYGINCEVIEFASVLPGMAIGKYDLVPYLHYTDERAENVLFSRAYCSDYIYCIVRKTNKNVETENIITTIVNSFYKNFIREDRWKLMLQGLLVTIRITLLTAFFGTLFGIILCSIRRSGIKFPSQFTKVFVRIMQGVPIVVLLLVLYYIIFAKSNISGITVGVIGFSLDFGVYVSEILRSGIEAIDRGQWEAALSLGFNKTRTYIHIILPQAIYRALPVYKGQFISMVKMTSVVGYVAVQDLTKVSDIIRSRTYDAFMPIITTAIVYFILAWILTSLISLIEFKTDPTKRNNILKGINTNIDFDGKIENQINNQTPKGNEIINIKHLRKEYSNVTPLKDVNAVINKGDIISIIGPSGTGKSTLIRMLNRLEEPTSGEVYAFGKLINSKNKEIYDIRANMGMVFQSFNLFNHLTVIENLMIAPVIIKGVPKQVAYEKGMNLLKRVGLKEKALNYPSELSGGQKQRVAIVRTLTMNPEVMLLDEPTSALDPTTINEVLHVIEDLARTGITMLIVTHELKFAQKVANRVFYMDEGGIYEEGTSYDIFNNPQKERTKAFIKHLKLFTLDIESKDFDFISLRNKLETFGYQQMIQGRINNSMILCIEEIFTLGIAKLSKECFPANLKIEYNEDNILNVEISYKGEKTNAMGKLDGISKNIVESLTNSLEYEYNENKENIIKFIIK